MPSRSIGMTLTWTIAVTRSPAGGATRGSCTPTAEVSSNPINASARPVTETTLCSKAEFEGYRAVGVVLTPIITKDTIALDALRGRTLAVDGNRSEEHTSELQSHTELV